MSTNSEIIRAARQAAIAAVGEVLARTGAEPELITYGEIRKLYGRKMADNARASEDIEWYPGPRKGVGNISYCKRSEFREYLFNKNRDSDISKSFSIIN